MPVRQRLALSRRATDLGGAGKKSQNVARTFFVKQLLHGRGHLRFKRRGGIGLMRDAQRKQAALRAQHWAVIQKASHGARVQRRRHHDQSQVRSRCRLQPPEQRQREVALEMPLVKLVQHHGVHAREPRIGNQPPREDTFGEQPEPSAGAGDILEAHLVPDCFAQALAHLLRDPSRR